MTGCALIQQRVQRQRGGNCRCFLLVVTAHKFRVARSCTKCKVISWELMLLDMGFLTTNKEVQYNADCLSSTYSEHEFLQFLWDPGTSPSAWGQAESQGEGNVRDYLWLGRHMGLGLGLVLVEYCLDLWTSSTKAQLEKDRTIIRRNHLLPTVPLAPPSGTAHLLPQASISLYPVPLHSLLQPPSP